MTLRSAARKLVRAVLLLIAASMLIYLLSVALPGDAVEFRTQGRATAEEMAQLRQQEGLDQTHLVRYGQWIVDWLHLDPGTSLVSGRSVTALIAERLDVSLALTALSMAMAIPTMLALAWLAADGPTWLRRPASVLVVGGAALPVVAVGVVLASLAAWISSGVGSSVVVLAAQESVWWQLDRLILPALVLGLPTACYGAGILRGPWADAAVHPSVLDARVRGLSGLVIARRYVFPRVASAVLRTSGLLTGGVLGGAAVVETMFGISGLGALLVSAVGSRDQPVVLAVAMLSAAVVIVGFTAADLASEVWRR